ncbi:hypothetical protein KKA95_02895 [Patescibacteria group bacterium]|nr:hypothetical protein [Patescibacteria group bacterium]
MDIDKLKPAGLIKSLMFFSVFGVIFYFLSREVDLVYAWGLFSLILFITAILAFRLEGNGLNLAQLKKRFRLKWFRGIDWKLMIGYSVIIAVFMISIYAIEYRYVENFGFRNVLTISDSWMFVKIIPMLIFNIFGEEYLWRGYLLPKQQLVFKNKTWLVNGVLWLAYYLVIGWQLVLILLPLMLIPHIAQNRKNTCDGVVVHGMVGGMLLLLLLIL